MSFSAVPKVQKGKLYHRRCGLRGRDILKFMAKCPSYQERGFDISPSEIVSNSCVCEVCTMAKMKKNHNHQLVDRLIYRPGEFWYVDVHSSHHCCLRTSGLLHSLTRTLG